MSIEFPPPVGESPVLRGPKDMLSPQYLFPPPVGESPVLRSGQLQTDAGILVSTPCRGITCAESIKDGAEVFEMCFHPLSGNHLC